MTAHRQPQPQKPQALITGASRGIGLALAQMLTQNLGYRVWGIARNWDQVEAQHPFKQNENLIPITLDLTQTKNVNAFIPELLRNELKGSLDLLVHNAGMGLFAPHEELNQTQLLNMLQLNFTTPVLLTRHLLRALKQQAGKIVFIGSTAAHKTSAVGAAYSASKAGLEHFAHNIFEECRKTGLQVFVVSPDITQGTQFYENTFFEPHSDPQAHLNPQAVADMVKFLLSQNNNWGVVTHTIIKPQKVLIGKKGKV